MIYVSKFMLSYLQKYCKLAVYKITVQITFTFFFAFIHFQLLQKTVITFSHL